MMSTGSNENAIRTVFARQGVWCRELGSPLTGLLCELAGRKLDRSTRIGRRILDWPNHAALRSDALPLRLTGGLHACVFRGKAAGDSKASWPLIPTEGVHRFRAK